MKVLAARNTFEKNRHGVFDDRSVWVVPRGASDFGSFGGVKNNKSLAEMLNFHEKILESWCPERALRGIDESALVSVHECPHFFSAAIKIFKSDRWAPEKKKKMSALEASQRFFLISDKPN